MHLGAVANGNYIVKFLTEELLDILRGLRPNIDVDLFHDIPRPGIHVFRMRSRAEDIVVVACQSSQYCFCHLASRGIACTQEENPLLVHESLSAGLNREVL